MTLIGMPPLDVKLPMLLDILLMVLEKFLLSKVEIPPTPIVDVLIVSYLF
jgi:hypothetical protein